MERWTIPQLIEHAWNNLILLPPVKDQGKRDERKQLLLRKIREGHPNDLSVLPLHQLQDYVRHHRLRVELSTKKEPYITAIEEYLHGRKKTVSVGKRRYDQPSGRSELWWLVLLRTRVAIAFRLGGLFSVAREWLMKEHFWQQRLLLEGFLRPNLSDQYIRGRWRLHYLEATNYPLAGDVYGIGYNQNGMLGIHSRKVNIKQPERADIDNVIDCDWDGHAPDGGLSVFLRSDGRPYSAGYCISSKSVHNEELFGGRSINGWNLSNLIANKLAKKHQYSPPQMMDVPPGMTFERIRLSNDFIFLLGNRNVYCYDLHVNSIDGTISNRFDTMYSVLPNNLVGRVTSISVNQIDQYLNHLLLLDDDGRVHYSRIKDDENGVVLEFKEIDFTEAMMVSEKYGKNPRVVRFRDFKAKEFPNSFTSIVTEDRTTRSFTINKYDMVEWDLSLTNSFGYHWVDRNKGDYFVLQLSHPYHNERNQLWSKLERVFPFVDHPQIEL